MRHLPFFYCLPGEKDEFLGRLVDDIPATGRKTGFIKEKRGSSGAKAASQAPTLDNSYGAKELPSSAARTVCVTNMIFPAALLSVLVQVLVPLDEESYF